MSVGYCGGCNTPRPANVATAFRAGWTQRDGGGKGAWTCPGCTTGSKRALLKCPCCGKALTSGMHGFAFCVPGVRQLARKVERAKEVRAS